MPTVTPSLLYDYLQCPHKVWRDVHGPRHEFVEEENAFLKLLWDRGVQHEAKIIAEFAFDFVDCSKGTEVERVNKTNAALADRAEYIYQGVLAEEDLFGIPDLLHWDGSEYCPIEIKSGSADEGGDDSPGKLKKHYSVQLALYSEILQRRGLQRSARGAVIDVTGQRFEYDLSIPTGPKSFESYWRLYKRLHSQVVRLLLNETQNEPANCSNCKNCGWYHSCKKWVEAQDDITQIFYIGRTARDAIKRDLGISNIAGLLQLDQEDLLQRKKSDKAFLKGVGESTIEKMVLRARLMKEKGEPLIHRRFEFPDVGTELFFDIETDPTQDFVYLHGFWVRDKNGERFREFTARRSTPEDERRVFSEALA